MTPFLPQECTACICAQHTARGLQQFGKSEPLKCLVSCPQVIIQLRKFAQAAKRIKAAVGSEASAPKLAKAVSKGEVKPGDLSEILSTDIRGGMDTSVLGMHTSLPRMHHLKLGVTAVNRQEPQHQLHSGEIWLLLHALSKGWQCQCLGVVNARIPTAVSGTDGQPCWPAKRCHLGFFLPTAHITLALLRSR